METKETAAEFSLLSSFMLSEATAVQNQVINYHGVTSMVAFQVLKSESKSQSFCKEIMDIERDWQH